MKADTHQSLTWAGRAYQLRPQILKPDREGAKGLRQLPIDDQRDRQAEGPREVRTRGGLRHIGHNARPPGALCSTETAAMRTNVWAAFHSSIANEPYFFCKTL